MAQLMVESEKFKEDMKDIIQKATSNGVMISLVHSIRWLRRNGHERAADILARDAELIQMEAKKWADQT